MMFSKFICPYCYEKHKLKDCIFRCSYNHSKKIVNEDGTARDCYFDPPVKKENGKIAFQNINKCIRCNEAALECFCPRDTSMEIPFSVWYPQKKTIFQSNNQFSVALIGAKESGKSNYIGVLVKEMESMNFNWQCSLLSCDDKTREIYNKNYRNKLYNCDGERTVPNTTDKGKNPPLIYSLRFKRNKSVSISFYDTAGENFDNQNDIIANNSYITNANGIIVLLDPLQIPAIRKKLEGKIKLPDLNGNLIDILSRLINLIRATKKIRGKINIPIALVFTKMDVLAQYGILPDESFLRCESEHSAKKAFVMSDFQNTNIEIKELLDTYLCEITQLIDEFSSNAFFGVSALGQNPIDGKLSDDPKPLRVLDPLLWLLAEKKYIDKI